MKKEFIFAGFGGQGMLLIGKFLAMACMLDGSMSPGCLPTALRCAVVPQTARLSFPTIPLLLLWLTWQTSLSP